MKRPARKPSQLPESLHKRLSAYTLAASAAGVGVLALTQPAEARIVYTKAQHVILGHPYALGLNHDGIRDFLLSKNGLYTTYRSTAKLWIRHRDGNSIVGNSQGPEALYGGARIAAEDHFIRKGLMALFRVSTKGGYSSIGPWANVNDRYLGLKFYVKGKVHYGWAPMSVNLKDRAEGAILTSYVYETIPNKPIIAGKTKGPDVVTVQPATLGHLAAGASAIPAGPNK
jgi:hypothetical protein